MAHGHQEGSQSAHFGMDAARFLAWAMLRVTIAFTPEDDYRRADAGQLLIV